ncbi:MAG: Coenzyme F420 hydrogenase/dehydrogenase, beta subunit C-terminal domain [Synergistaceae bacterium]|nr:Coenzyme F420 hydrogenase/dehydrogenase, beta subunit C-terminal domain [Synergistaceae bacterium]
MIILFNNKEDCCGCSACFDICPTGAIQMIPDEEGFLYPEINTTLCTECGMCKKACVFQKTINYKDNYPEPFVYALKHKSDEVVTNSSSGGAFTAISDHILEQNGIVYGAAHDEKLNTIHIRASNSEERDMCRGSKYVQSDLTDVFTRVRDDLIKCKKVLFTGTPCQVAGLNEFIYVLACNTACLLTVDLVCHGTPSPKLFKEYLSFCESKRKKQIKEYYHRPKDKGWGHTEKAIYMNGHIDHDSSLSNSWRNLFYSNLFLRPSCYVCKYTNFQRPADVTIADYWGIEKAHPEFMDKKGVSLALVNTLKGMDLFESIKDDIIYIQSDCERCVQRNLKTPTPCPEGRGIAWGHYKKYGFEGIARKYGGYNFKSSLRRKIKSILG